MREKPVFEPDQLAYCGLYCLGCSFKVAYETQNRAYLLHHQSHNMQRKELPLEQLYCGGCKTEQTLCGPCELRDCAQNQDLISCADCGDFPCEKIISFGHDGIPHHQLAYETLQQISRLGLEPWFDSYLEQLYCKHCGERLSWYYTCPQHHDR